VGDGPCGVRRAALPVSRLAGIALALAGPARARRRGLQIVGLAFLFRLQSWVISRGPAQSLLKVDILNVMGVSMIAAGVLWGLGRRQWLRVLLLGGATGAAAMVTPVIRTADLLAALPDPVEWYFRPSPGRTTFTLFPWGGFLLAGAAVGVWLGSALPGRQERRINVTLACLGTSIAAAGYAASLLPPIYAETSFWTSSPTFFFLRLGIVMSLLPLAYAWSSAAAGTSPLDEIGRSSLFVYWIHVEMVYGVVSTPLHRRLPFAAAVAAYVAFCVFLYALVRVKQRLVEPRTRRGTSSSQ
jgi:uncharacterized membrane protein